MNASFRILALAVAVSTLALAASLAHAAPPALLTLTCRPEKPHYAAGENITLMTTLRVLPGGTALAGKCIQLVRLYADGHSQVLCRAYTDAAGRALCPSNAPAAGQRLRLRAGWVGDEQAGAARSAVLVIDSE